MRKHPVSIALSKRVLEKIDKEASKQKRSRSEYIELFFEEVLLTTSNLDRPSDSPLNLSKKLVLDQIISQRSTGSLILEF
jgi:hypothetical protein